MVKKRSAELGGHLVFSEGDLDEDAAKIRLIEILTKMHQKLDVEGFCFFIIIENWVDFVLSPPTVC